MHRKNTIMLLKDFPNLFREARLPVSKSCMGYGFACNDGWFDIVYRLSAQVEAAALADGIDPLSDDWPAAVQVKEKFGVLSIHISAGDKFGYKDLINDAANKSKETCDFCGAPGVFRTNDYYYCRCNSCEAKKKELLNSRDAEWRAMNVAGGMRKVIEEAFSSLPPDSRGKRTTSSNGGSMKGISVGMKIIKAGDGEY